MKGNSRGEARLRADNNYEGLRDDAGKLEKLHQYLFVCQIR